MSNQRNTLVTRQTLYALSASVGDAHFPLQVACMRVYAMVSFEDKAVDDVYTDVGAALLTLRTSCVKLEVFLFTLSEQWVHPKFLQAKGTPCQKAWSRTKMGQLPHAQLEVLLVYSLLQGPPLCLPQKGLSAESG